MTTEVMIQSFTNQTDNGTTASPVISSITPMAIAAVALVMVISTVAVIMNSGILMITYGLKLIRKDYRMIYYVLITATDLTFSVHSVINCMTVIFRDSEFFKQKWFCLILQCSGTVSYQISAMSIIMLIFDLFISIRNPFDTETRNRLRASILACIIAIIIASSLAYGPFIWWFGQETKLEFCSIANLYGVHFHDYHIMATSVLAILFLLMIVASVLLLHEIKLSIQPRRLISLKIPKIYQNDSEDRGEKKISSDEANDDIGPVDTTLTDSPSNVINDTSMPDLLTDVEKVTTSLSNYSGIENKAFNKEERMSIRDKLLQGENNHNNLTSNDNKTYVVDEKEETALPPVQDNQQYTEAYETMTQKPVNHEEEDGDYLAQPQNDNVFVYDENINAKIEPGKLNNVHDLSGHVNPAFDFDEGTEIDECRNTNDTQSAQPENDVFVYDENINAKIEHGKHINAHDLTDHVVPAFECDQGTEIDECKNTNDKQSAENGKSEPQPTALAATDDNNKPDKQRLSVDTEKPYRGSTDKVRRLTGTEAIGRELKQIEAAHMKSRKKFIQACKTVAAFMTAFLGCGLPYYILSVVELSQGTAAEDTDERRTVRVICALFLYVLPIVDPILYTSRFEIVRLTIYRFLPKCCRRSK